MSFILVAALALASPTAAQETMIAPQDRPAVAAAARRMQVPTRSLYRAMTAPQSPRRADGDVRYCMPRARVVSGKKGAVCRTRHEWADFGLLVPNRRG
jgi:hypothetical protein